jgi:hypothetical protein
VGPWVGVSVGRLEGSDVGTRDGICDGACVGSLEGLCVGVCRGQNGGHQGGVMIDDWATIRAGEWGERKNGAGCEDHQGKGGGGDDVDWVMKHTGKGGEARGILTIHEAGSPSSSRSSSSSSAPPPSRVSTQASPWTALWWVSLSGVPWAWCSVPQRASWWGRWLGGCWEHAWGLASGLCLPGSQAHQTFTPP